MSTLEKVIIIVRNHKCIKLFQLLQLTSINSATPKQTIFEFASHQTYEKEAIETCTVG